MQQSSATLKNRDVGIGLRKIVACSQSSSQCLLVSTVFGTVSSLQPIYKYKNEVGCRDDTVPKTALQSRLRLDKKLVKQV